MVAGAGRSFVAGDSGVFITSAINPSVPGYVADRMREMALLDQLTLRNKLWVQHYQKHLSTMPRLALRGLTRLPFVGVNGYKFGCDSIARYGPH
jgi:hypothetical protein